MQARHRPQPGRARPLGIADPALVRGREHQPASQQTPELPYALPLMLLAGREQLDVLDVEHALRTAGAIEQLLCLARRLGQGELDQHVLAPLERGARGGRVLAVGRAQDHAIDRRIVEHDLERGIDRSALTADGRRQPGAWMTFERAHARTPGPPQPHHGQRERHGSEPQRRAQHPEELHLIEEAAHLLGTRASRRGHHVAALMRRER